MTLVCTSCAATTPWEAGSQPWSWWREQHPDAQDRQAEMSSTEQAAAAYTYAAGGWKVFPVWWVNGEHCGCPAGPRCEQKPGKHPIGQPGAAPNGVSNASDDLETVTRWWTRWPRANIGLAAHANGLAVLDIDPDQGGDQSYDLLVAKLAGRGMAIPPTLSTRTGSGGRHLIFTAPEAGVKNASRSFGLPGLDTRGRGGYMIAPPSRHASGNAYQWLAGGEPAPWPDALTRLMDPPKPKTSATFTGPADKARTPAYALKALEGEADAVRSAGKGARNHRLNTAAFSLGTLVGAGELDERLVRVELYGAALACGLSEREAAATILSGLRGGKASPRSGRAA